MARATWSWGMIYPHIDDKKYEEKCCLYLVASNVSSRTVRGWVGAGYRGSCHLKVIHHAKYSISSGGNTLPAKSLSLITYTTESTGCEWAPGTEVCTGFSPTVAYYYYTYEYLIPFSSLLFPQMRDLFFCKIPSAKDFEDCLHFVGAT